MNVIARADRAPSFTLRLALLVGLVLALACAGMVATATVANAAPSAYTIEKDRKVKPRERGTWDVKCKPGFTPKRHYVTTNLKAVKARAYDYTGRMVHGGVKIEYRGDRHRTENIHVKITCFWGPNWNEPRKGYDRPENPKMPPR